MRSSIRVLRRIAFLAAVGAVQLTGCMGGGDSDRSEETGNSGSLKLALQTAAPSGSVYRLRNAVFVITDARTAEAVDVLVSDDQNFSPELITELAVGDYTVTLQPGWFLERISGPGTGPGPGAGGGRGPKGGAAPFPEPGQAGSAGRSPKLIPGPFPGDDGVFFGEAGDGGVGGAGPEPDPSGGKSFGGSFTTAGRAGSTFGGRGPTAGRGGTGATGGFGGEVVEAQLLSNAIQFFTIFGGGNSFVNFHFRVGNEIIDFSKGRLHIDISVEEEAEQCVPPPPPIDQHRVMIEHNASAMAGLSVLEVFGALANNERHGADPVLLYQQLIDSYASDATARLPDAIHCGDEQTDGEPSLNGYRIDCDRRERFQFDNIDAWFATAFVNRIDLAPENGAHCGQQRVIFANNAQGRMFFIFESQIPNPTPELGLAGCAPIARFWLENNDISDPVERGARLRAAFLTGTPELAEAGFGPFLSPSNHTVGTGTIRTNNFDDSIWTLREFKLGLDGAALTVIPFPVAEAPNGQLWNDTLSLPQGAACREDFIRAAEGLLSNHPAEMAFVVDHACKDSESRNDSSQAYAAQASRRFLDELTARFGSLGLSGTDIANRAHFAGSCIGCHVENNGVPLGNGAVSPNSLGFVHVSEFPSPCSGGVCFPVSDGLERVFLPRRLRALADLLEIELPPDPCQGGEGGAGGFGGSGPVGGFGAGGAPFPPPTAGRGSAPGAAGAPAMGEGGEGSGFPPAPIVEIELPQASAPVEVLQEQDSEIRSVYGERTLGGRVAQVTH